MFNFLLCNNTDGRENAVDLGEVKSYKNALPIVLFIWCTICLLSFEKCAVKFNCINLSALKFNYLNSHFFNNRTKVLWCIWLKNNEKLIVEVVLHKIWMGWWANQMWISKIWLCRFIVRIYMIKCDFIYNTLRGWVNSDSILPYTSLFSFA